MAPSPEQTVTKLIAAGQYGDIAPELDVIELQTADLDQWPHALQLLGHIYNGDLEDARFIWKRASDTHKQSSELKAAFALLQQLWNKNYQGVWPALTSFQWSESAVPLVQAIAKRQQQQAIQLVSFAQSQGWQLNGETIVVHRKQPEDGSTATADHLQHLTEFVVQLET